MFTLQNLKIIGCDGSSSIIVLNATCEGARISAISYMWNVSFEDNSIFDHAHIINAADASCSLLEMTGAVFHRNRCIGTHCVSLGARSRLTDIRLIRNRGSRDPSLDSSIFSAPADSESIAISMSARRNQIRSFHNINGTLSIADSQFSSNRRNQSSVTRDSSSGGGVLFLNQSSVSISNSVFKKNYALNGGSFFASTSQVSITNCTFHENNAGAGNGGAVFANAKSLVNISSTVFSSNRGYFGAAVYSNLTVMINVINSRFLNNNSSRSGAIDILNGTAIISSCDFYRNRARKAGGALFTSSSNLLIGNSSFLHNEARFGGACYFAQQSTVVGEVLHFESNKASDLVGGGIGLWTSSRLRLKDSLFQNNHAVNGGGAITSSKETITQLKNVQFLNNTAGEYGGAIWIIAGDFSGVEMIFRNNRVSLYLGGAIYVISAKQALVSRSVFEENTASLGGAIYFSDVLTGNIYHSTFIRNSVVQTREVSGSSMNSSTSSFDFSSGSSGGSLCFSSTNCTIVNSSFVGNSASSGGGAVDVSQSLLRISTSSFIGNLGRLGGAIRANSMSNLSISHTLFLQSQATNGGSLYLNDGVGVTVSFSQFLNNTAYDDGGAIELSSNSSLLLSNSTVEGSSVERLGGAMHVKNNSTLLLIDVRSFGNRAQDGGFLSVNDFSNATITDCLFTNNTVTNNGGVIQIESNSTLFISSSSFSNNKASSGGTLSILNNCTVLLRDISMKGNIAVNNGGGINIYRSVISLLSTELEFNNATSGGCLFAIEAVMELKNSTISNCFASQSGGAMHIASTNLSIETTQLGANNAMERCGGIAAFSASIIIASNSIIAANSAGNNGGGICVSDSSILCYSCLISNNRALSGAGLYAYSNNSILVVAQLQNSKFENNSALLYGGAVAFQSPVNRNINCSSPDIACGHIILLNTSMIDNYANTTGAAVLATDTERVLVSCEYERKRHTNLFTRNGLSSLKPINPNQLCRKWRRNRLRSDDYGDIVGTFGQTILLSITEDDEVTLTGNVESGFVLENVNSGKLLPDIIITVLDGYGKGPAPTVPQSFEASLFSPDNFFRGEYSTNINAGSGLFTKVIGFAIPGNYTMRLTFENEALEPVFVIVVVRECTVGEEPTNDRRSCQKCDDFSYNFDPKRPGGCTTCPETANCSGNYIVPKDGYWHMSPCHDSVEECLREEACKYDNRVETLTSFTQNFTDCNMNEAVLEPYSTALCKEGYQGFLCGSCKESFGISLRFQCLKCPRNFLSLLTLIGLTIYLLCASLITIRGCLPINTKKESRNSAIAQSRNIEGNSIHHSESGLQMVTLDVEECRTLEFVKQKQGANISRSQESSTQLENEYELTKWRTTEIFKIMINFLQTISIAATIGARWTGEIIGLFEISEYIGAITATAITGPVDCLASSCSAVVRSILRMLFSLFIPGIVVGILGSAWCLITFKQKKGMTYFWRRLPLSLISVVYISYLGLTKMAIRAFYCVHIYNSDDPSVNSRQRLWAVDTSIKCFTKDHSGIIALAVIVLLHAMHSTNSRALKQRTEQEDVSDEYECGLTSSEIQRYYDRGLQRWLIDDEVLMETSNDIQSIINCTSDNDVVVLQSSRRIAPATTVTIPWNLTVTGGDSSVILSCPRRGPLLMTKTPMFTLQNLNIIGCDGSSSIIVLNPPCGGARISSISYVRNVSFEDNSIFDHAHIINAADALCSLLEITEAVFRKNRCIGTHCVSLGARSRLTDVRLIKNKGSQDLSLDSSIFSAPADSETVATIISARRNQIRSFHVINGTLSIANSHFSGNRRNQSSVTRDSSSGGGVLFLNQSSVSISNSVFKKNYALNGGSLFASTSQVSISNCTFHENNAGAGNGGAVFANANSLVNISSSVFSSNRGYFGAAVFSNLMDLVTVTDTRFVNNNSTLFGGIFVRNGTVTITACEFLRNSAGRAGAALLISTSNLSIRNTSFTLNEASFGGACFFEQNSTILAERLKFLNNTALEASGGSIQLSFSSVLRIQTSLFQSNHASRNGGAIATTDESTIELGKLQFLNNTSTNHGGAIEINTGNCSGSELTFCNNSASIFGGAVRFHLAINVSISRSKFEENLAGHGGAIHFYNVSSGRTNQSMYIRNSCRSLGGAVQGEGSNIDILSSSFVANVAKVGGAVHLEKFTNCMISNSSFNGNLAQLGGAVHTSESSLLISVSIFKDNRGRGGGAVRIEAKSNIDVFLTTCLRNHAFFGGCVSLGGDTNASISRSQFSNNTAENSGGAIDLVMNSTLSISDSLLSGTLFLIPRNSAESLGGAIDVTANSSLRLTNVESTGNSAQLGGAIFIGRFSSATISNSSFTNNRASSTGGALDVLENSRLFISNSIISNNRATIGGGISIMLNSFASLRQIRLTNNTSLNSGGGMNLYQSVMSLSYSELDHNRASFGGFLMAIEAVMELRNSTISNCFASQNGGAILMSSTNATIEETLLEWNHARVYCGGLAAFSASHVNSSHIIIRSNSAGNNGGGICVSDSSILCYSCQISNNRALSGAGLYAYSNNSILVVAQLQNSKFENNSALSHGGAVAFQSPVNRNIHCSSHDVACGHIILLHTSIIDNYANTSGAAVFTTDAKRVLVSCEYERKRHTDYFTENHISSLKPIDPNHLCRKWKRNRLRSDDYGGIVGTFGQTILLSITEDDEVTLTGNVENGYVLENVNSGKLLPDINITVLDGYGKGPAPTEPQSFEASLSSPNDFFRGEYSTNINAGSGLFTKVVGFATPQNYTMIFTFQNETLESLIVIVVVRECTVGEEPTNDRLTCQKCDPFSYNFDPSIPGGCTTCPKSADCSGNYIVPKDGYWHMSPCHDSTKECLTEEACKYDNRVETLTNFTKNFTECNMNETVLESYSMALCKEGYRGLLCGSCTESFGISLRFQCLKCPQNFMSVLILIGLIIYLLCASIITIRGCLPMNTKKASSRSAIAQSRNTSENLTQHSEICVEMVNARNEENVRQEHVAHKQGENMSRSQQSSTQQESDFELTKWRTNEIFKIMINFLQTISIASAISVQWTGEVIGLFETSEYLGAISTAATSGPVDCLASSCSAVVKAILRMLTSLFIPGIVVSILGFAWCFITFKQKKGMTYFWRRLPLSLISVVYISYLGLTKMAIRAFYCVHIDNSDDHSVNSRQRFWAIDTSIQCYTTDHNGIIALAVIVLFVVSIGFPLLSTYVLIKNKEQCKKRDSWIFETAGFLFRAFKGRYIFWESLVMLRKACLSIVVVFSYSLGGQSQGILAMVIQLICLYLHVTANPYRKEFATLNHFEAASMTVSCLTFTLGLFFTDDRCTSSTRSFLSVTIVLVNVVFFSFLLVSFLYSSVIHLRVALRYSNIQVPNEASCWHVLKLYITYKVSEWSRKGK
eukprot:g397.t1